MRVAYLTLAPFISGAERSLQTMLRALPDVGVNPMVVCPPGSPFAPWCRENGIDVAPFDLVVRDKRHPFRWLGCVRTLRRTFRERGVQLVHSNQIWSYPAAGKAAMQLGLPRVCHLRDEVSRATLGWWLRDQPDMILCISRHIEQQFLDNCRPERRDATRVLLNPVQITPRRTADQRQQAQHDCREALELPQDHFVFGFIGQVIPVKGLPLLIEALQGMASQDGWTLVVAGRDPRPGQDYVETCRRLAQTAGIADRVRFVGFLEDPTTFYDAADVVVVPSLEEPLGRIPLEAATRDRPAIAFDVGGLPETIQDGQTGWLVPRGSVSGLRSELQRSLQRDCQTAGQRAQAWVEQVAAPDRYVACLNDYYEELLQSAAPRRQSSTPRVTSSLPLT